jgi:hypothetical protein
VELFAACPFAVSTMAWEPAPGRRSLTVCVKATFSLAPGRAASIAPLQEPITGDLHEGGDPRGALVAVADLVPFKRRAEVLLVGHAYAPGGAPTDALIARAWIGGFRKALNITGDRAWVPSFDGVRPSVAVPFRRMPLRYERAARTGENLAGVDIMQIAEVGRPLPNIAAIADQGGETPGFAPLPLLWRAHRLGLGDDAVLWASRLGLGLGPAPAGFDSRLFNAAPAEQQLDEIPPGVEIVLENLSPDHPRLDTRLPGLRARLFRRAPGSAASAEIPMRCDTLWIDTDRGLACASWRGGVPFEGPDDAAVGRLVVVAAAEGERIEAEQIDRMLARFSPEARRVEPPAAPAVAAAELVDEPTPQPGERRSITLIPPAPGVVAEALPFRPPPTGFQVSPRGAAPVASLPAGIRPMGKGATVPAPPMPPDDEDEKTPPRGTMASSPPLVSATPLPPRLSSPLPPRLSTPLPPRPSTPAPPADPAPSGAEARLPVEVYCAIKLESWQVGVSLREVLGRRGIDEATFRAHELRWAEALEAEAALGQAERALALLDAFQAARGRARG